MFESTSVFSRSDEASVSRYFASVYKWMTLALAISGFVAWQIASNAAAVSTLFASSGLLIVLFLAQIGCVIALSAFVNRMSGMVAAIVFILYSALTGLTLSSIFLVYTAGSIAQTFFVTAGSFAALSAYGYFTRRDLSGMRGFLMMSLIGIILASLVNFWLKSPAVEWIASVAGIFIFAGLTAYDTQKLKAYALMSGDGSTGNLAILGALTLYLDFINLFLFLLRFMGNRRR